MRYQIGLNQWGKIDLKILYVTTIGSTMLFFKNLIYELIERGDTIDIACNETESKVPDCYRDWHCKIYPISWERSPICYGNIAAIRQLYKIVNRGCYDIVHCHTPIAAACTRIACCSIRRKKTKIIYTAHGFHFYKGAPLQNWLLYYPIEWICAHWTDVLITINKEDYLLASKKMKTPKIYYVPGVGIDSEKFRNTSIDKKSKRAEIGVPENAFLLLSVGELNQNKNHETIIRALAMLNRRDIHYVIAGTGLLKEHLLDVARKNGVLEQIHLLGFRHDVEELYKAADIFVHPSFREGLPVSIMEAMASGLPCIVSDIRGNKDLIEDKVGGFLCDPMSIMGYAQKINVLLQSKQDRMLMGQTNSQKAKAFDVMAVNEKMRNIYYNTVH